MNISKRRAWLSVYVAPQIANQRANRAFAASVDLMARKTELEITAPTWFVRGTIRWEETW